MILLSDFSSIVYVEGVPMTGEVVVNVLALIGWLVHFGELKKEIDTGRTWS